MNNSSTFTGRAGEYAVASQLLVRGIQVHFPAVDSGVDLIAGDNIKIQVKASRRSSCRPSGYSFGLGNKRIGKYGVKSKYLRDWTKIVDFLVCWGIDENRFWILPTDLMAKYPTIQTLLLGTKHHGLVNQEMLFRLINSGMRQCDVAREMNIHPVTVSEHVRGRHTTRKYSDILAVEADEHEGAWGSILAAVNLMKEVESTRVEALLESKSLGE